MVAFQAHQSGLLRQNCRHLYRSEMDGLGTGIPDLVRLWPLQEDVFRFESRRTQGGWEISYAIPHAFVSRFFPGYAPAAGAELRGNFYKCGDKTVQPHYLVWNPIPEEKHTFHSPVDFGRLIFG